MKKLWGLLACLFLLIWTLPAFALPDLQLDIVGGYYNEGGDPRYDDETVVAGSDIFTLVALMQVTGKTPLDDTYTLSMALFPPIVETDPPPDLGSFEFDGDITKVADGWLYGNPGIPAHGVFDTYYILHEFKFDPTKRAAGYNTQDNPGEFEDYKDQGTDLYYVEFLIDATGLSDNVSIHFDLFNDLTKAPFSHDANDAQSDPPPPIPEPATMLLLGSGLIGMAAFRRRFRKN